MFGGKGFARRITIVVPVNRGPAVLSNYIDKTALIGLIINQQISGKPNEYLGTLLH